MLNDRVGNLKSTVKSLGYCITMSAILIKEL